MATPKRHAAMKKPPRASRIREEILREWRGAEEPADLNAGIHLAQKFVAAILRTAGAEDGLHEDQVRATTADLQQHTDMCEALKNQLAAVAVENESLAKQVREHGA